MHFAIEEQTITDVESGLVIQFSVDRHDTSLVAMTVVQPGGASHTWHFQRNGGLKSEESTPVPAKGASKKAAAEEEHEEKKGLPLPEKGKSKAA